MPLPLATYSDDILPDFPLKKIGADKWTSGLVKNDVGRIKVKPEKATKQQAESQ